jgi:hypothetical protein
VDSIPNEEKPKYSPIAVFTPDKDDEAIGSETGGLHTE